MHSLLRSNARQVQFAPNPQTCIPTARLQPQNPPQHITAMVDKLLETTVLRLCHGPILPARRTIPLETHSRSPARNQSNRCGAPAARACGLSSCRRIHLSWLISFQLRLAWRVGHLPSGQHRVDHFRSGREPRSQRAQHAEHEDVRQCL